MSLQQDPRPPVWFRYDDVTYAAPLDEFERPMGRGRVAVELTQYEVESVTKHGVWLRVGYTTRFCKNEAHKRFACPTQEEAMESFIARKQRQLRILTAQANHVREALRLAGVTNETLTKGPLDVRAKERISNFAWDE